MKFGMGKAFNRFTAWRENSAEAKTTRWKK
jgi:hypothetical protein